MHRHLVSESRLREGYKNRRLALGGDEPKQHQQHHSSGDDDEDEDGDVEGEVLMTNDGGAGHIVDDRFDRQYDEEQKEIQQLVDEI